MKFLAVVGLLASGVAAFPFHMDELVAPLVRNAEFQKYKEKMIKARDAGVSPYELDARQAAAPQGAGALPLTPPPFNASQQYVSNQGAHAVSR